MTTSTFKLLTTAITIASVTSIACQKEIETSPLNNEQHNSFQKSPTGVLNSDKQDRNILFVSARHGNDEVYAMNDDGSNLARLTDNPIPNGRAAWSSNGQHAAFSAGPAGNRDIYVMNANGNGLRNISNTPGKDEEWPEWSPQGNKVIYSSNKDDIKHEIYLYDFDDESTTRLTFRTQDDKWPTFSPDGSKIAFQSDLGGTAKTEIFVMNANGTGVTQLTFTNDFDQMPSWKYDGTKIAFMSRRDGNPEIYVINANGSDPTRLTNFPGVDARPSWSRIEDKIVFTSTRDFVSTATTNYEIYIMNGDGSNAVRLTNNVIYDDYPFIK